MANFESMSALASMGEYALYLIGTTLIFVGVLSARVRILAPFAYLGRLSFGLYVFHEIAIHLTLVPYFTPRWLSILPAHRSLGVPAAFLLSLGAAAVFVSFYGRPYSQVEAKVRDRPNTRTVSPAAEVPHTKTGLYSKRLRRAFTSRRTLAPAATLPLASAASP